MPLSSTSEFSSICEAKQLYLWLSIELTTIIFHFTEGARLIKSKILKNLTSSSINMHC